MTSIDILMITHRRPAYTRMSLRALAGSLDDGCRVWVWQNGDDEETLSAVDEYRRNGVISEYHHSRENLGLRAPTNWFWDRASAHYVSKVDDDCLVDSSLWPKLRSAQVALGRKAGVVAAWRFLQEDFAGHEAMAKVQRFPNGVRIMRNHWVQGSSYLVRRSLVREAGGLGEKESFPDFCIRLARSGHLNGWVFPFVSEEHMDDPRSAHTMFRSEHDFREHRPLHAKLFGITDLEGWTAEQHREAMNVQNVELWHRNYRPPVSTVAETIRGRFERARDLLSSRRNK